MSSPTPSSATDSSSSSPRDILASRSSTAAAHSISPLVNPLSYEYESYGEWGTYMTQLKRTHFPEVIQNDLYVNQQQAFTVTLVDDSGDVTKYKQSSRTPDASLHLRRAVKITLDEFKARYVKDHVNSHARLISAVKAFASWELADGWIPVVETDSILLFVEIKPGASWQQLSLNYKDPNTYMDTIYLEFSRNMDDACQQAQEQAQYFFARHPHRESVVAFAAAGFKWCWRVFTREEIGQVGPLYDGTFKLKDKSLNPDALAVPSTASESRRAKSGKRRPRESTDSQPSHPDNKRPEPKRTRVPGRGEDSAVRHDSSDHPRNAPSDYPGDSPTVSRSRDSDPPDVTANTLGATDNVFAPELPYAAYSPDPMDIISIPESPRPVPCTEIWQTYLDNVGQFRNVLCGAYALDWSPVQNWGTQEGKEQEKEAVAAMIASQPKNITDLPYFRAFIRDKGIQLESEVEYESEED